MADEQLLTYSVRVDIPWRSGVVWYRQTGANEQEATIDGWRNHFGSENEAKDSFKEFAMAQAGESISFDIRARYKKTAPDASEPWWNAPLKVHSMDIGSFPPGDGDPRWRPVCIYIGTEDLIAEKTARGYVPSQWEYTVQLIYIAYWPDPGQQATVTLAPSSTQGGPV